MNVHEDSLVDPRTLLEIPDSEHPMYLELTKAHIIRLVELLPGAPNDPITTRLSIHELEHAPDYEAISYVWGDPTNRVLIECNSKRLNITVSLDATFRRIRFKDRPRIVWADAICINQASTQERNHHVAFMNIVYQHAKKVLVNMGDDSDGGARNVAALINEHVERTSGYSSLTLMPVLADNDPILDDIRWKSLAALFKRVWFTRAWVLQEVGVAADPRVLWGNIEFSYRDLMQLSRWIVRCASQLEPRAGICLLTIHTDWEDWSGDWEAKATYKYTLIDFLSHAKGLECRIPHDHIYAFLGHPLAQKEDSSGPIIVPQYEKPVTKVYQELTAWMLPALGLKVLSAVEHDDKTINGDIPSWTVRWDMDIIQNSMGYYPAFYYRASGPEELEHTSIPDGDQLMVRGMPVDIVQSVYQFSAEASHWEVSDALTALQPASTLHDVLDRIWSDINGGEIPHHYSSDQRLDAFSLTLCAGLINYECAEENLEQHRANFSAFWKVRHQVLSRSTIPTELQQTSSQGNADTHWYDLSLSCKGRSFFVTQRGYFGLGPWILKPGDECYVLSGARVPFALRKIEDEASYKTLGEAYIHGIMHGEFVKEQGGVVGWTNLVLR